MVTKILQANEKFNLFNNASEITVALSGGADSVALLFSLVDLRQKCGFKINAAHYNHSLRGKDADEDEIFCKKICQDLEVPFVSEKGNVALYAKQNKKSIELAAREMRYEFLERVAKGLIATAHNANDSSETIIHNLVRGTGLLGMTGISPKNGRIIRPIILCTRKEIEDYCNKNGLKYRTDKTNFDTVYTRNYIRHEILPQLSKVNSKATEHISQLGNRLFDDNEFLMSEAKKLFEIGYKKEKGLELTVFENCHRAMASRLVTLLFFETTKHNLDSVHIETVLKMIKNSNNNLSVNNGYTACLTNGFLNFKNNLKSEKQGFEFVVNSDLTTEAPFKIEIVTAEKYKNLLFVNNLFAKFAVDYDKMGKRLIFRNKMENDKITLTKRNVTKTLKKLFIEDKIDKSIRDKITVLSDELGVVWVENYGADKSRAVSETSKNIMVFYKK